MFINKLNSLSPRASKRGVFARGFTLIELMIVVLIIGVLAALAYPTYQDYAIRARVSEAILAGSACNPSISEGFLSATSAVTANTWGCEVVTGPMTKYVDTVVTDADGKVTVTLTANTGLGTAASKKIKFQPTNATGTVITATANMGTPVKGFKCSADDIDPKYLPSSCK